MPDDKPLEGTVLPPSVRFVYTTEYTDKTNVVVPPLGHFIRTGAIAMLEWESLKHTESAPWYFDVGSVALAIAVVSVHEYRGWLNFKNKNYYLRTIGILAAAWVALSAYTIYQYNFNAPTIIDPQITTLQSELATARRDRDLAILERDTAKRERGQEVSPSPPAPSAPPTATMDDLDARIDVWKSIDGQMDDLSRVLIDGNQIVTDWKSLKPSALSPRVGQFRNHLDILRQRLGELIGANPDFSDLRAVDVSVPTKLRSAIENLFETAGQTSDEIDQAGYENSLGPYIGPLRRQLIQVKTWIDGVKHLAESSVADLSARRALK
jgi:hypothetical protein